MQVYTQIQISMHTNILTPTPHQLSDPGPCPPTHTTLYPTHPKHTNTKTTPHQSSPLQMSTQIISPTHSTTYIQFASQTYFTLPKILKQHENTQFKYKHITAQLSKRNDRPHVGIARREISSNLQNEYNIDTKTNKTTPKIQNQENRKNSKTSIFCPIR
jgi:hypothetical protein